MTEAHRSMLAQAGPPTDLADRIVVYGVEGIGKSTFGAAAPDPLFIAAEDGLRYLKVQHVLSPRSLEDVHRILDELAAGGHKFRTLVVDTVDWLDPIIQRDVCRKRYWIDLESPGYGKGWMPYEEEWRRLILKLDEVRAAGVEVILLGHCKISTFQNPSGPDYSRYELAVNKHAGPLIRQWADFILFARHETDVAVAGRRGDDSLKKGKATSTGAREVCTAHAAAWDAKRRCELPDIMPLDYAIFAAERAKCLPVPARVLELRKEFADLLAQWKTDRKTRAAIDDFVGDQRSEELLEKAIQRIKDRLQAAAKAPQAAQSPKSEPQP